ncbi:MAG: hypothetical protein IT173_18430 [Acidobacteria bacterium]|nr:hypothetical protein [Acidobacteriota bacterium]
MNRRPRTLTLTIERTEFTLSSLESAIESADLHMQSIVFQPGDAQTEIVQLTVDRVTPDKVAALIDSLRDTQGVKEIRRDS